MGNLILCHDRHAAHPYEISRIHCRIFTIEELCYYLCNNLYLIDYTIMNEPLCTWLEEEIGMKELAEQMEGKALKDAAPVIMAASNKLKQQGKSFTPEETALLLEILTKDMTPQEKAKVEMMKSMMRKKR